LQKYKYDYTYINSAGTVTAKSTYSIPNSWIVDGVNNSVSSKFAHTLTSAGDGGWTSVGTIDKDPTRFGKSVRRKVTGQMTNGKNLYQDTNNSSNDFVKDSQPSLKMVSFTKIRPNILQHIMLHTKTFFFLLLIGGSLTVKAQDSLTLFKILNNQYDQERDLRNNFYYNPASMSGIVIPLFQNSVLAIITIKKRCIVSS
jgi:hypothetical protein